MKLTTGDSRVHGGGPRGMSAARTCQSRLRKKGRDRPYNAATRGQESGDGRSEAEIVPDQ